MRMAITLAGSIMGELPVWLHWIVYIMCFIMALGWIYTFVRHFIVFSASQDEKALAEQKSVNDGMEAVVSLEEEMQDLKGKQQEDITPDVAMHILVVDDDAFNLKIAQKILGVYYEVRCLTTGEEVLAYLEEEIPDLILLDIHMPQMDGFEVLRLIREGERTKDIPVIFLTADDDREAEIKGFQLGAMDFITKPFIADIMLHRVKRILELVWLQKNTQQEVERQTRTAEERLKKIERLSIQMMRALAETIDAKDEYTNGHSLRVAEYSEEIMKRMGGSKQEQEDVYYIGLLHDIGKIGIPDAIIRKTTDLTEEEYALIKSHPVIGADILKNISEIPGIDVGAKWHHEKYDGTGYPDGLKGEQIPMLARLVGVADAYDAMASKRSYRDVLPQETVRQEIEKGKGTQFDPYIADIMLQMIDDDKDYRMRER